MIITRNTVEASSLGMLVVFLLGIQMSTYCAFFSYDYEEVPSEGAADLVKHLDSLFASSSFVNSTHKSPSTSASFTVSGSLNFSYKDPIDGSLSSNQGHIITFSDGSRVVFRLSGTGSQGATVRMYVERYSTDPKTFEIEPAVGLKGLIEVALEITQLKKFLGRDEPTVITVSFACSSVPLLQCIAHTFCLYVVRKRSPFVR